MGGCIGLVIPNQYLGISFRNGERPPQLEELELAKYPFGRFNSDYREGYPADRDEEAYWAEVFDWSRLRVLRTSMPGLAIKLLPFLTSLEELSLHNTGWYAEALCPLLMELPATLKAIEVDSVRCISWEVIVRHGVSLTKLRIHEMEKEAQSGDWSENALSDSSLVKIREQCLCIEQLALDVARHGKHIFPILSRVNVVRHWQLLRPAPSRHSEIQRTRAAAANSSKRRIRGPPSVTRPLPKTKDFANHNQHHQTIGPTKPSTSSAASLAFGTWSYGSSWACEIRRSQRRLTSPSQPPHSCSDTCTAATHAFGSSSCIAACHNEYPRAS